MDLKKMKQMTWGEILAYTAGIVDGEGCISIYRKRATCKRGYTLSLKVVVVNTEEWLCQWLKMQFGGNVGCRKKGTWARKHQWGWYLYANKAIAFLGLILPYLKIKRSQAEIAIDFQLDRPHSPNNDDFIIQEANRILLSKLKK